MCESNELQRTFSPSSFFLPFVSIKVMFACGYQLELMTHRQSVCYHSNTSSYLSWAYLYKKITRFPFGLQLCLSCYNKHSSSPPASGTTGPLPEVLLLTCYATFFVTCAPLECMSRGPASFGSNM